MALKLIIGIGNPDEEYRETRHNIGFMAIDMLAKKAEADDFASDKKLNACIAKGALPLPNGKSIKVIFAKPQSYVNLTGPVVAKLKNTYKVKPEDIIVIQDDLDIEFGNTKLSFDKNSGGHKGIDSVIASLKTKKFYRIRLGTAKSALDKARQQSDKKRDEFVSNFVLGKFTPGEREKLKDIFKEVLTKVTTNIPR